MRRWFGPAALVLLMFAGYVKASPVLEWVPIDLTLLALLAVLAAAVTEPHRGRVAVAPTLLLVATCILAAMRTPGGPDADLKMQLLFLLTLPAMIAAPILVSTPERVRWLLRATVIGALGIGLLVRYAPSTADLYGRLALQGSNTIATGRACGAGLVALFVLALTRCVRWVVAVPVGAVLLLLVFGSGSRGPLLGAAVACIAVGLTQRGVHRVRGAAITAALVVAGGWWGFSHTGSSAAARIALLFAPAGGQGASISDRQYLYRHAWAVVDRNPAGVGWGGLEPYLYPVAQYPHDVFLEVFGEGGWLAGLVFTVVVVIALLRARRDAAVLGLLIFWLTNAMFSGDVNDNRALFMLLGIGLATRLRSRQPDPVTLRADAGPDDGRDGDRGGRRRDARPERAVPDRRTRRDGVPVGKR